MSISTLPTADRVLDSIIHATWDNPGTPKRPRPKTELLPEHHLRTLLGLLLIAGPAPFEPFRCARAEWFSYFAPRKRTTDERAWDGRQLDRSLEWLVGNGYVANVDGYSYRLLPARLTAAKVPAWEHARALARATVRGLRLGPAETALLARAAYHADPHGVVRAPGGGPLSVRGLAEMVGLTTKTLSGAKASAPEQGHLATLALRGASFGIKELVVEQPRGRRPTTVRLVLCAPTAHVEAPKQVALHASWPGAAREPQRPGEHAPGAPQKPSQATPGAKPALGPTPPGVLGVSSAQSAAQTPADEKQGLKAEAEHLAREIWHPKLLLTAMELAEGQLQAGHPLTLSRKVNNFLRPVISLQRQYKEDIGTAAPALIKYALEQTIKSEMLRQPDTRSWHKYLAKVCSNHKSNYTGQEPTNTNAAVKKRYSPLAIVQRLEAQLGKVYECNKIGDSTGAQSCLVSLLSNLSLIAPALYAGDQQAARTSIIEAYKTGSSYGPDRPFPYPPVDYLPASTWPHEARLPFEPEAVDVDDLLAPVPPTPAATVPATSQAATGDTAAQDVARRPEQPSQATQAPVGALPAPAEPREAPPGVIGVQLAIDGRSGPRLVREQSGVLSHVQGQDAHALAEAPSQAQLAALAEMGVVEETA
jgi:hypothetical protein